MEGVEFIACFPPTPIINAAHEAGIRLILTRKERVAVNIADGYARVSRRPGVASMMQGGGVENAFAGVAQAWEDLVPILVLPGGVPRHSIGSRTFDTIHCYLRVTKWVERINLADRIPEMMRRAFTYLKTGRPSPVLLEVPDDVAEEELDEGKFDYKPVKGWKTPGDPEDVRVAVRALLNARNPLIYVGEGVFYAGAWEELREFAELVQAPVMTSMKAKSVFPENHPLSVGFIRGRPVEYFLKKADLIFSIGASLAKVPLACWFPPGKTIVQSTIDEWDINKDYRADHVIIGDSKLVLRQLIEEVKRQGGERPPNEALMEEIRRQKEEWLKEWMPYFTSSEVPINPYRVIWDLMNTVDRTKTIVTHDSGNPRDQLSSFYEAIIPRGYIGWGHITTLGYSLGGAMGAKLAEPEKTVINVMGDGAFGMVGMDFETAVREKIPITTIILNNYGFGGYDKYAPYSYHVSGNYYKVAEGLGAYTEKIEEPDEVGPAIKRAIKANESGKAALLEIRTRMFPVYPSFPGASW